MLIEDTNTKNSRISLRKEVCLSEHKTVFAELKA